MHITITATPSYRNGEFVGLAHISARDIDGQRIEATKGRNEFSYKSTLHGDGQSLAGRAETSLDVWVAIGVQLGLLPPEAYSFENHAHEFTEKA